jgi:ATP-binding cassette, subfamily C, bacterial LapB
MSTVTLEQPAVAQPLALGKSSEPGTASGPGLSFFCASILINILAIAVPVTTLLIYDRVLPNGVIPTLGVLILGVIIIIGIDTVLRMARVAVFNRASARDDHLQRDRIVADVFAAPPLPGGLPLSQLTSALAAVNSVREYRLLRLQAIIDIPFGLAFLVLLAAIGGWLALIPAVACLGFAVVIFLIAMLTERTLGALHHNEQREYQYAGRILGNLGLLKTLTAEIPAVDQFVHLQGERSGALRQQAYVTMLTRDLNVMFSQLLIGCVVVVSALLVLQGNLTFGGLAACTLLAGRALEPMQTGFQLLGQYRTHRVAKAEIANLVDRRQPGDTVAPIGAAPLWDVAPEIELQDVSVVPADKQGSALLSDVNLHVGAGEFVAITADRGFGKTILARALLGLVQTTGTTRIGGYFLDRTTADLIRRNVTYLGREPDLPAGRIMDVLTDGDEMSYWEIRNLSQLLGLDEAIKRLPNGYDTVITLDTQDMPTGVLQQLAIVRGLAKKHKLIVFDDATFALDAATEMRLAKLMEMLKREVTAVLLTDRPAFRHLADWQFTLTGGHLTPTTS